MSISTAAASTFEATVENAGTGLLDTLTVRIEDGQDNIVTAATPDGIVESGIGIYTTTLIAPDTAGQYLVIWNDGDGHEASEDLVITGSVRPSYFSIADLRARYPELTVEKYDDDQVQDAIDTATEAFERAADVAFSPTDTELVAYADHPTTLPLPLTHVTAVSAAEGATSGTIDLASTRVQGGSYLIGSWPTGENVTLTVTHGYATPPLPVVRAVQLLARTWLVRGPVDDRATQIPAADGGVINLATPGLLGQVFGIPFVDATLQQYRHRDLVP